MRLHHTVFFGLLITPMLVCAQERLGTYEDRVAVEDVMARYVWAVHSILRVMSLFSPKMGAE